MVMLLSNTRRRKRAAFTLVELLVVLGIIGLLVAILLPSLIKARRQALRVACQSNLRQLGTALLAYAHENRGWFPGASSSLQEQDEDWVYWQPTRERKQSRLWAHLGGSSEVLVCPMGVLDRSGRPAPHYPFSYSVNILFTPLIRPGSIPSLQHRGCKLSQVVRPSQKMLAVEEDSATINDGSWNREDPGPNGPPAYVSIRHDGNGREYSVPQDWTYDPEDSRIVPRYRGRGNIAYADGHVEFVDRRRAIFTSYLDPSYDGPFPY
jgi:prepilin-type processing-associated H-X9-DG protein/prepilin-type N-terminal cleavage/methylation domain-containing protein